MPKTIPGEAFDKMDKKALDRWFKDGIEMYPKAYVQKDTPWQQSGFSGPEERWVVCRGPIADYSDASSARGMRRLMSDFERQPPRRYQV